MEMRGFSQPRHRSMPPKYGGVRRGEGGRAAWGAHGPHSSMQVGAWLAFASWKREQGRAEGSTDRGWRGPSPSRRDPAENSCEHF